MKYEWKKGDKLRIIDNSTSSLREYPRGTIVTADNDVCTNNEEFNCTVILPNGNKAQPFACRYEKVSGSKYVPKKPTHLVVWDETSQDPCKFFTSELDAKKFIKELSERSNVVKNSVVLVEIKSSKKVNISKVLRYEQHKI